MLSPLKAIRQKCLDCMADQPAEVRLCPCKDCALYPYRMGHNPNRKGVGGKFEPRSITDKICEEWF